MKRKVHWTILFLLLMGSSILCAGKASVPETRKTPPAENPPPFHDHAPTEPLPATLDPASLRDNPPAFVAYSLAARIRTVLYQVPCYCPCGRLAGHKSLLDCFTTRHGVSCKACQTEAIYCFEQHKKGKTPAQIREAMQKGEMWRLNLDKYVTRFLRKAQRSQ